MSETTTISWATSTWNPWEGCTKISPGCQFCYAEARNQRFHKGANWGKGKPRRRTSESNWKQPLKWNVKFATGICAVCERPAPLVDAPLVDRPCECGAAGFTDRPRIFPSLCDWLDDEVPIEWLADFLKLIHGTPNLDYLLLTKRPENFYRVDKAEDLLGDEAAEMVHAWATMKQPPANVWIGVSVEDQQRTDERIPELLKIPAKVRFLSVEPLLGAVDLEMALEGFQPLDANLNRNKQPVDWVIVGGESGPKARPCNVEWIRSIVSQCKAAEVPCFVKQLGSNPVHFLGDKRIPNLPIPDEDQQIPIKIHDPKGGHPAEWPEDLRIRQFPKLV
jgi:protein gp37